MLVILGPTSTGKTDIALNLAKKFNGELVACDSRQVYKDLDIGTGKLPGGKVRVKKGNGFWELDGIKVWMYDVADFKNQYSIAEYVKDSNKVIREIEKNNKLPIIVGGTGLYLKALLYGLSDIFIPTDPKLRKKLESLSLEQLQESLNKLSFKKWQSLNNSDKNNKRRLVRYIELITMSPKKKVVKKENLQLNILKIGLKAPKDILNKRVDERVVKRVKQGMVEEANKLIKEGLTFKRMNELGLEYRVLANFLTKKIKTEAELIEILQHKIHQYVKRQLTWFKKEKDIIWFDITNKDYDKKVEKVVAKWYHRAYATKD